MTVTELREKRAGLVEKARDVLKGAEAESRALNAEEQTRWDGFMAEADTINGTLERLERQETEERTLRESRGRVTGFETARENTDELRSWLKGSAREYEFELRAQSFATSEGAELVPEGFVAKVEVALQKFGGVRNHATPLRTNSGQDLPFPLVDDVANKGTIINPNAQRSEQDLAFGVRVLKAYTIQSGIIRVPFELMEDSAINLESFIADRLGERLGRGLAGYLAVGTGVGEPEGIAVGATAGPTQDTLGAITWPELLDIEHSVDPAYRVGARWLFNDQTLKAIKKITNSQGDPIFIPGDISKGIPSTVLGYPFTIVQELDGLDVVDGRSIIFGDLSKYVAREVRGIRLQKLSERYAEFGQVAFLGHMRADGALIDAGTHPVTAFVNAAA